MIRLGFHAVTALYAMGVVVQLSKLAFDYPWQALPIAIDWAGVLLGCLGGAALVAATRRIEYRGRWEKPVHFLVIAHLAVSVVLHAQVLLAGNRDAFIEGPRLQVVAAICIFAFFAWRSWTIRLPE